MVGRLSNAFHTYVHLLCFYTNHYISFNYEDIFTKFAVNVYSYENISTQTNKKWLQNYRLFENHQDALKLELLQLASSNLHKRYVAGDRHHGSGLVSNVAISCSFSAVFPVNSVSLCLCLSHQSGSMFTVSCSVSHHADCPA